MEISSRTNKKTNILILKWKVLYYLGGAERASSDTKTGAGRIDKF